MKIYGYTQFNGLYAKPTGVPKHIDKIFNGLAAVEGVDFSMLVPTDERPQDTPLAPLPVTPIPYRRRVLEYSWLLMQRPNMDQWCPDADWIYCPVERSIPTRKAKLAASCHSLRYFDKTLPFYHTTNYRLARLRFSRLLHLMARNCTLVLTVSQFLKKQLVEMFRIDHSKIAIVGNGAEPEFFQIADAPYGSSGQPGDRPYVLTMSGLNHLDGAQYFLPVARELLKLDPDLRILVAGHQHNARYIDEAKDLPNVQCLGYVHSPQLAALLHDSVALLFLNIDETFGLGIVEAMAARTPVIGTNFTAVPEVVSGAGMIVDENDAPEIARRIVSLARTPSLRQDYVARGALRAQQFTWTACVERLMDAFRTRR